MNTKFKEFNGTCDCGASVLYLAKRAKESKDPKPRCLDCKLKAESNRSEREFWRMITDAIRAKNENKPFYPLGYGI